MKLRSQEMPPQLPFFPPVAEISFHTYLLNFIHKHHTPGNKQWLRLNLEKTFHSFFFIFFLCVCVFTAKTYSTFQFRHILCLLQTVRRWRRTWCRSSLKPISRRKKKKICLSSRSESCVTKTRLYFTQTPPYVCISHITSASEVWIYVCRFFFGSSTSYVRSLNSLICFKMLS